MNQSPAPVFTANMCERLLQRQHTAEDNLDANAGHEKDRITSIPPVCTGKFQCCVACYSSTVSPPLLSSKEKDELTTHQRPPSQPETNNPSHLFPRERQVHPDGDLCPVQPGTVGSCGRLDADSVCADIGRFPDACEATFAPTGLSHE